MNNKLFEPLRDGIARLCRVTNIAEPGDTPREGLVELRSLPFDYQTVGVMRKQLFEQSDVKISELITVPQFRDISTQDVVILRGVQYQIRDVQHVQDTRPPTTKLALERLEENYAFQDI